jgi:hypothetical protein
VKALPLILDGLIRSGFQFVTLESLIGYEKDKDYRNIVYRSATSSSMIKKVKKTRKTENAVRSDS